MKNFLDMKLSGLGVGTYLGDVDDRTSEGYRQVIKNALQRGIQQNH